MARRGKFGRAALLLGAAAVAAGVVLNREKIAGLVSSGSSADTSAGGCIQKLARLGCRSRWFLRCKQVQLSLNDYGRHQAGGDPDDPVVGKEYQRSSDDIEGGDEDGGEWERSFHGSKSGFSFEFVREYAFDDSRARTHGDDGDGQHQARAVFFPPFQAVQFLGPLVDEVKLVD